MRAPGMGEGGGLDVLEVGFSWEARLDTAMAISCPAAASSWRGFEVDHSSWSTNFEPRGVVVLLSVIGVRGRASGIAAVIRPKERQ